MKTKKILLVSFAEGIILCTVIRIFELFFAMNLKTMAYQSGHISVYILNTLLLILAGGLLFLSFNVSNKNNISPLKITKAHGITAVILIPFMLYYGFSGLFSNQLPKAFAIHLLEIIFFVLSLISLMLIFFNSFSEKSKMSMSMLMTPLLLWSFFRMVSVFVVYISIANISERMFNIVFLISLTIFLLNFSKGLLSSKNRKNYTMLLYSGMMTVIFGYMTTISRCFVMLFGHAELKNSIARPDGMDFLLSTFALISVLCIYRSMKPAAKLKQPQTEDQAYTAPKQFQPQERTDIDE